MFELMSATKLDLVESELRQLEAERARLAARQVELIIGSGGPAALMRGCQSVREWLAGRLDLAPETAIALAGLAERIGTRLLADLADGSVSLDRAIVESKLEALTADAEQIDRSRQLDVGTVSRLAARHRRHRRLDELSAAHERYLSIQPNLDFSAWRLAGLLPGADGALVEEALRARADTFPAAPPGLRPSPGQLRADALVAISQDSLEGSGGKEGPISSAMIFIDASLAARPGQGGERGAEVEGGVRVGPGLLEELLCSGRIGVTFFDQGQPVRTHPTVHAVPPALKRFITFRDHGVCTADGCQSRYRLQPHHITPHHQGGPTTADNLTLLCWYHHHVVVHTHGYRIDPDSHPHRRRFQPAHLTRPPPA
ncbi:MAG TPA: DUF222 domain-containing protein [Acidimicrobiia bacterium]